MSKKAKKLTSINLSKLDTRGERLDNTKIKFKISIHNNLDNKFGFDNIIKNEGHKEFHNFICGTIGKGLTISEVNKLYLRTRGKNGIVKIDGTEFEEIHYGKDRSAFRVFGYYHRGEFILTKIDTNHKIHK